MRKREIEKKLRNKLSTTDRQKSAIRQRQQRQKKV